MPTGVYKRTKEVWNKGKKMPFRSKEHSKKISDALKGKTFTEEHKRKLSKSISISVMGSNNPNWRGGISKLPYSLDWTETLRKSIRERDKYTCQICSSQQGDILFDIHHIDYNKENCCPNNLITLCRNCHSKTNGKREWWIKYFNKIIGFIIMAGYITIGTALI
jgi:exonuclease III